jgi:hypothetical protein
MKKAIAARLTNKKEAIAKAPQLVSVEEGSN